MSKRIYFLDVLRVVACFMVIIVHSTEFFYLGDAGPSIASDSDALAISVINSPCRVAVPLFVLISAYLLVPLTTSTRVFFRKRLTRVVIPFIIWSILYATLPYLWGAMNAIDVKDSLLRLIYNFNDASGHLWFIYMLIGLYLFMPVISPWLDKASAKAELCFLAIWLFTTFFHYFRYRAGDIWGECVWNEFGTFWYFSGYIGYIVLAHFIRRHLNWNRSRMLSVGTLCFLIGYAITAAVFYYQSKQPGIDYTGLELGWSFCTFNLVIMSFGVFIIFKAIFDKPRDKEPRIVLDISRLSYGMYLMHIFVLGAMYSLFKGTMPTIGVIACTAITTFPLCYIITRLLAFIPGSKWIVG